MNKKITALCRLTKEVIEDLDTYETERFLENLLARGAARKFQDSLLIEVGGYSEDPRELWEIPEVRLFVKLLDESFPFWFHFCEKEGETLKWISLSLIDYQGADGVVVVGHSALLDFVMNRTEAMNYIHRQNDYSREETAAMTKEVLAYFQRKMPVFPRREG